MTNAPTGLPLQQGRAADEYLLEYLETCGDLGQTLILHDAAGRLTAGLATRGGLGNAIVVNEWASGRSHIAGAQRDSDFADGTPDPVPVVSILEVDPSQPFDTVVFRVPKSNAELVDTLHRIRPHLTAETEIVGSGMVKHIHTSTLDHMASIIGPTTTSLAKKKARLIHSRFDPDLSVEESPWPNQWRTHGVTVVNHGGGFSPDKLDIGTQFLLDTVSDPGQFVDGDRVRMVDLGCGNGIVGLVLARRLAEVHGSVEIVAIDDSALAVDATEQGWAAVNQVSPGVTCRAHHADRMVQVVDDASADLVVVNPPFHDDRAVGDHIAWSMFVDAHKVLRPGGSLIVVGNRHLAYHAKLKKIFGAVDELATNKRFVIHRAIR